MHRPEKWGYVQFTREPPGRAKFNPDPAAPAREVLQEIYYAQKDFRRTNKRWAKTLAELSLPESLGAALTERPVLAETPEGYRVTVGVKTGSTTERWHIRQDARVWKE
jgi:hypothetical protein